VRLSDEVIASVLVFSMVYLLTMIGLALALAAVGLDFVTALTGAATAIGNVGPGLGEIIGPAGNFSSLPDAAIWILSLGMLLGRLELMTVFVLLSPVFWRS
jgi:trk system potassium uptake protein TrkH